MCRLESVQNRLLYNFCHRLKSILTFILKNDFFHSGKGSCKSDRFNKLNIQIKEKRNSGEFIILSEPSIYVKKFFQLDDWVKKTIAEISKYTDRKIYVHNKQSKIPLDLLLNKAWAFVSDQSTAGFKAMLAGVPAHFTNKTLKEINSKGTTVLIATHDYSIIRKYQARTIKCADQKVSEIEVQSL